MRFRKSIKLLPGIKINLSNSGISTSVGPKGATVNLKPGRATRATVGLPGTGLSHTETLSDAGSPRRPADAPIAHLVEDAPPRPLWLTVPSILWRVLSFIVLGIIVAGVVAVLAAVFGGSKRR